MPSIQARTRTTYDLSITRLSDGKTRDIMLARDPDSGSLLYRSGLLAEIVDSTRNDQFSYDHRDPRLDLVASFEDFTLGAGFEDAPAEDGSDFAYRVPLAGFRGYNYTQGVDLSGTRGYLANDLRLAGAALDTSPRKILLTSIGLLAMTTRYIYRWSGTSWTQVFDDGAGGSIYDLFEFTNATATYVVAATRSAAYHYTTDGITWTASEAGSAAPAFRAAASTSTAGATSLTVGEPSGATTGDILILTVEAQSDTVTILPNTLSDWNLIATLGATGTGTGRVYWCRRGGSAPDYQMNFGSSVAAAAAVSAFSGGRVAGSPIEASSVVTNTSTTITFTYTGDDQTFDVPAGITSLAVTVKGASTSSAAGGLAAGALAVTPLETLHIRVGGMPVGHVGGYNGGGAGSGGEGGAGASDIRQGGMTTADRVAVGGGAGGVGSGGSYGSSIPGGAGGAGGGATGASGSGGSGPFGSGGAGATTATATAVGGDGDSGGGGGYLGGNGGAAGNSGFDGDDTPFTGSGGGGKGGSGYVGGLTGTTSTQGGGSAIGAHGSVTISYTTATTSPTTAAVVTLGTARLLVGIFASEGDTGGTTAPGGGTERVDVNGSHGSIEMFTAAAANPGTFGPYTATFANSVSYSSVTLALLGVISTGPSNVTRWAMRGQSSGAPVLWAINDHGSIRNATLVTTPGNWSGADAIQVGQRDATQLGLEVIDNVFYLVHRGGITSYDGTTVNTVFISPFADPPDNAARPVMGSDNLLFLTYGSALLRLDATSNQIEKIWPRGPQEGNAELNGTITAMAVNEKFVWFALKNADGRSYVMQIDHSNTATVGTETIYPAHTIAYTGAADIISMAYLKADASSVSTTNPVLAIGSGASVEYYTLPKPGLRPEDDSACRFDRTPDRVMVGAFVNFRAQAFPKWLTRGDIEAATTATETVEVQYEVPDGVATSLVTADAVQTGRTTATLPLPPEFTRLRYRALLNTGADTATPVLVGIALHAAPNAPRDRGFIFTAHLADDQPTRQTGVNSRWNAAELDEFLFGCVNSLVRLRDIFGNTYVAKVLDIQPQALHYDSGGAAAEDLQVTLGQLIS